MNKHEEYLGDGCYASFDGEHIVLTTGDHDPQKADAVICLERPVFDALVAYEKRLHASLRPNQTGAEP